VAKVTGALYISYLKNDDTVVRSQLYDSWNRWAFVCRRKDSSDEAALICAGRLFHARTAATGKAQSPRVTRRVGSTSSVVVSAERR